jgi:hypothetical protein
VSPAPFILGGIAIFVIGKLFAMSGQPDVPPPLPPAAPRRPRKRVVKAPPSPTAAEPSDGPSPLAVAPAPVVAPMSPRAGQRAVRREFASRDALRRAIVAQEVLGPPLALRPPRQ